MRRRGGEGTQQRSRTGRGGAFCSFCLYLGVRNFFWGKCRDWGGCCCGRHMALRHSHCLPPIGIYYPFIIHRMLRSVGCGFMELFASHIDAYKEAHIQGTFK